MIRSRAITPCCRQPLMFLRCHAVTAKLSNSNRNRLAINSLLFNRTLTANSFQLQPKTSKEEDALFSEQVQGLKRWWDSPRFKGLRRDYTAEDVASKRGALQQEYPSSLMAKKLHKLLKERAAAEHPVHTSS